MTFLDLLANKNITTYQISKRYGIPKTTLHDICSGKTNLMYCNGKTLLDLSKSLDTSIEKILFLENEERKSSLPKFLFNSIDNLRKSIRKNSTLIDAYYDELASSINVAEIDHLISKETAQRLRRRYFND